MQEVSRFIRRGEDDVDYVLYCKSTCQLSIAMDLTIYTLDSGHADQHPSDDPDEEDGNKECGRPTFFVNNTA